MFNNKAQIIELKWPKDLNRHFSKAKTQNPDKHTKDAHHH
jgi:hypothetical protein